MKVLSKAPRRRPSRVRKVAAEPAPTGLRARKKAQLRKRIADVAIGLYRERGHDGTTLEEICRRADISQPTFYKYYPSKEAVLTEHATRGWGELLRQMLEQQGSLHERLQRFLGAIADQMTRERKLWHAIAISNAYNPVREPSVLRSADAGTRVLELTFQHGQQSGEITHDFTPQRLASMLEGILLRVSIEWAAGYPDKRPLRDAMSDALEFFMRAARP